jgi:hypothetical protein
MGISTAQIPSFISAISAIVIFSTLCHFPFLTSPTFPSPLERTTFLNVFAYMDFSEFELTRPPLSDFIFLLMRIARISQDKLRFFPALLTSLIPIMFTVILPLGPFSLHDGLFAGFLILLEASFSIGGRQAIPIGFYDFFFAIAFLAWLHNRRHHTQLGEIVEAVSSALALSTSIIGLVLYFHILIAEIGKRSLTDYFIRVRCLVCVGVAVFWTMLLLHITIVSGKSDILPFKTRFWKILVTFFTASEHISVVDSLKDVNPIVILCSIGGIASTCIFKEYVFAIGPGLTLMTMCVSQESFWQKVHMIELFGLF